jgi:hypothetical protein
MASILILLFLGISLLTLSTFRIIGNYGVETDFYLYFVPEARRLLAGEPLHLDWQPPFYPAVLAAVHLLVDDWFRSGLLISVLAAVCTAGAVYRVFGTLYGRFAAWGAMIGLMAWPAFLQLAITASSDVLYFSLMATSLAMAVGGKTITRNRAVLAGVCASLASLTRTNGITLILTALICGNRVVTGRKWKMIATTIGGFLLPWLLWFIASRVLNSPFFPTQNYLDVALTFYLDRSDASKAAVSSQFSSLLDIILYDPKTLLSGYAYNVLASFWKSFEYGPVQPPLSFLLALGGFLGIAWLVLHHRGGGHWAFWLTYAAQYGFVALRDFSPRYYLFLVPAFVAGACSCGKFLIDSAWGSRGKKPLGTGLILAAMLVPIAVFNGRFIGQFLRADPTEVIEAVTLLKQISDGSERLLARKPHVGFYANLLSESLPLADSEEELYTGLCREPSHRKTFLFFGSVEARRRRGLQFLRTPAHAPDWLLPLGHGEPVRSSWVLYELRCPS